MLFRGYYSLRSLLILISLVVSTNAFARPTLTLSTLSNFRSDSIEPRSCQSLEETQNEIALIVGAFNCLSQEGCSLSAPEVSIIENEQPNAWMLAGKRIVLTNQLVDLIASRSELAFVIAHEMAHHYLGHHQNHTLQQELEADEFALRILREQGLNARAPHALLTRLATHQLFEGITLSELFPSLQSRLAQLS